CVQRAGATNAKARRRNSSPTDYGGAAPVSGGAWRRRRPQWWRLETRVGLVWDGVETEAAAGSTAGQTAERKPRTTECAVPGERFTGVPGARGLKAACRREEFRDRPLVGDHEADQWPREYSGYELHSAATRF